ncbi:hypothetical protein BDC45DRAFT_563909 [Circinella umbellata]|nr:hypothetical protein BDC45DRAFT_563909 [Circinella umbellata]
MIHPPTYPLILICHWHVLRAWKKNILIKLIAKTSNQPKTLKEKKAMLEHALSLMMNMMRAETVLHFDLKHENFETGVLMLATNETKAGTVTSKELTLPSLRRQRVDVLVYILWSLVLSDLMQDHLCTVAKFKLRRMNKAERARLAGVNELNDEEAYAKIVGQEGDIINVLSFTDPNKSTVYDVLINVDDNFSKSCNQKTNKSACKHMYLINRVFNISLIRPQASSSSSFPSPSSSQQQ